MAKINSSYQNYLKDHGIRQVYAEQEFNWKELGNQIYWPTYDKDGKLLNERYRNLVHEPKDGNSVPKISGSGAATLYNEKVLFEDSPFVVFCEGQPDVVRLCQEGIPALTNTNGVTTFKPDWADRLKQSGKEVIFLFDNDEGGEKGQEKVNSYWPGAKFAALPGNKEDVCSFLKKHSVEELKSIIKEAKELPAKEVVPDKAKEEPKTIPDKLVALTLESCEIYLDQAKTPHVSFQDKPLVGFPVVSTEFKRWLAGQYWQAHGKGFSTDNYSQTVSSLEGKSYKENKVRILYNRIAKIEDTIYYDLGDDRQAVKINPSGWEVVTDCPVRFKRYNHQLPQVVPLKGGDLTNILKYINLKDESDRLLFLTYLVAVMIPDIPRVILVCAGDQGSGKSSALSLARNLIDPSLTPLIKNVKGDDLYINADRQYCVYLDNLSDLTPETSDDLAALATGISHSKRKLFTDGETVFYKILAAVGISGINLVPTRSDLLDRCLILNFKRLPDQLRRDESEVWKHFEEEKGYILGGLFDLLSQVLELAPKLELKRRPRMADYARYAASTAVILGEYNLDDFIRAFDENILRQNEGALDNSPEAQLIMAFMADLQDWEGEPSDLHKQLSLLTVPLRIPDKGKYSFAQSPNVMMRRLNMVKPNLLAVGLKVEEYRTKNQRKVIISRLNGDDTGVPGDDSVTIKNGGIVTARIVPTGDDSDDRNGNSPGVEGNDGLNAEQRRREEDAYNILNSTGNE